MPTPAHETPLELLRLDPALPDWVQTDLLGDDAPAPRCATSTTPTSRRGTRRCWPRRRRRRRSLALLHSVARDHSLVDGNKRLAWLAAVVFLDVNGSYGRSHRR
jgi:hypothetical protein